MIFLISLFLVLFSFANFFLSFAAVFSHNFCFSIFVGVVVGGEFLKQCEISRFSNFHNLRIFAQVTKFSLRTVHLLPTVSLPCNLSSLQPFVSYAPLIFQFFFCHNHQPPLFMDINWA